LLYPLKFIPIYKKYLWGGRNMESKLHRNIPDGKIAESWDICCRDDGMSIVSNGNLMGKSLSSIVKRYGEDLLGTDVCNGSYKIFPLLIKIIDANDKLSVQVHPDDSYAVKNGECSGKTEMWYIIDAKPGAKLVYGLKENMTKDEFIKAINNRDIKNVLNEVPVLPGSVFYIPAGTVHALLDGILVAEIQQNSNTTYRIYDWDRVDSGGNPRELHIEKALDVINFDFHPMDEELAVVHDFEGSKIKELVNSSYFSVEEVEVDTTYKESTDGSRFFIYMVISGKGYIEFLNGAEDVGAGETILIPASMGSFEIKGKLKMLKVFS